MTLFPLLHRSCTALLVAAPLALGAEAAAQGVPLPRPRPADAPQTIPLPPLRPAILPTPVEPPPPSACQIRLPDIATAEILPPVIGSNGCGIDDAVKLSAVTTRDNRRIAIAPPATLRCSTAEAAAQSVPLPRARPADAPQTIPLPPLRPAILPTPSEPPPPSACQIRLPDIAAAEIIPPVIGTNGCGIDDAVKLSAVKTRDNGRIAIAPPATLRCSTAEAIAHWLRDDVAPIAATLGAPLASVTNFAAYECRGRNRVVGALISEHGDRKSVV